jgi:tetratricopeptide (TPR) repeat protein
VTSIWNNGGRRCVRTARLGIIVSLILSTAPLVGAGMEERAKEAFRELQLGYVALDEGAFETAIVHYEKARDLSLGDEQRYNALFGLGSAVLELGRLDRARAIFDEAHELKPGEVECTFMLGVTCRRQGDLSAAVTYLAEAAARDPNFTQAFVELGITYGALERHADAQRICQDVLTVDPENIEARLGVAVALFHQDENTASVREFREVLDRDPENIRAHYGYGLALFFEGDREGAKKEIIYLNSHAPELGSDLYEWVFPQE